MYWSVQIFLNSRTKLACYFRRLLTSHSSLIIAGLYLPENLIYDMNVSPRAINITEFYTDIQMSNMADKGHPSYTPLLFATLIVLYLNFD